MRHQVVDAGVEAHFVDRTQTLGAEFVIQRPHFRRDVAGGDEMRPLLQTDLGDADMLVGGSMEMATSPGCRAAASASRL